MHAYFFPLFFTSTVGILLSSAVNLMDGAYQLAGLAGGLAPLMIYHIILAREETLSPSSIDGIYYFGFLVTIITLVSTAVSLGLTQDTPDLQWILLQFGLGLVATGYALFARLHLLSKASQSIGVIDATEKLAASMNRSAAEFDNAIYQMSAFITQTKARLEQLTQNHLEQTKKIEDQLQVTFDTMAIAANKVASEVANSVTSLAASYNTAAQITTNLSGKLSKLGDLETQITSINKTLVEVAALTNALTDANNSIADLSEKSKGAATAIDTMHFPNINQAFIGITSLTNSVASTENSLANLSQKAEDAANVITTKLVAPLQNIDISKQNLASQTPLPSVQETLLSHLVNIDTSIESASEAARSATNILKAVHDDAKQIRSEIRDLNNSLTVISRNPSAGEPDRHSHKGFLSGFFGK